MRADVPPAARGFEIQTADVRLEDLGTSFGIDAGDNGKSECHLCSTVKYGQLITGGEELSLLEGETAHLAGGNASKSPSDNLGTFPDISAIIERSDGLGKSRYAQWKSAAIERRKDPRLDRLL